MKRLRGTSGLCSCRQQRKVQLMQPPSIKRPTPHDMQHSISCATFTHTHHHQQFLTQQRGQNCFKEANIRAVLIQSYTTIHQHIKITDAQILKSALIELLCIPDQNIQLSHPIICIVLMHTLFCGCKGVQYNLLRTCVYLTI